MNRVHHGLVIGAVLYFLVVSWIMFTGHITFDITVPAKGFDTLATPRYCMPAEQLVKDVASLSNPFVMRFFEQVTLKGFLRNSQGTWSAIFQGPSKIPVILAPGAVRDGVTLLEADGRKCKIRCGTADRELAMASKTAVGNNAR